MQRWAVFQDLEKSSSVCSFVSTYALHLGFADLGTVLQQKNKPEINSLAIMYILFLYNISNETSCLLHLFANFQPSYL